MKYLNPLTIDVLFDYQKDAVDRLKRNIDNFQILPAFNNQREISLINNVVSLFGGRGTGKTTILLNLKRLLDQQATQSGDIPTRLFVPDLLQHPDAIGPAAIMYVEEALTSFASSEEKERLIKEQFQSIREDLAWFFNATVPNDVFVRDAINHRDFAARSVQYHQNTVTLPERFGNIVRKCLQICGARRLVFLVDDADITIDMTEKVLEFIRYFLSIQEIVTVVCADGEALQRRLLNSRIANLTAIDRLPSGSASIFGGTSDDFKTKEITAEKQYVDEYLIKLLPPANRVHLVPADFKLLYSHKMPEADNLSVEAILQSINFKSKLTGSSVSLGEIVSRYPGVIESNLRSFVNQFNQFLEIASEYESADDDEGSTSLNIIGDVDNGLNIDTEGLSDRSRFAITKFLQTILASSLHEQWRDSWKYYGIISVLDESNLVKLLNVLITRPSVIGNSLNSLILQLRTGRSDVTLSDKEQSHVFHVVIDLALHFGVDFERITTNLNMRPSEGYRPFYLSADLRDLLSSETGRSLLNNADIFATSTSTHIVSILTNEIAYASNLPVHVFSARDFAMHMHYCFSDRTAGRIRERNEYFEGILEDDTLTDDVVYNAKVKQAYEILFYSFDCIVDQVRSTYSILSGGIDTSGSTSTELMYVGRQSSTWTISKPIDGWSFLNKAINHLGTLDSGFDRIFLFLLHMAQHSYSLFVSAFAETDSELQARNELALQIDGFIQDLRSNGFLTDEGVFVSDVAFDLLVSDERNGLEFIRLSRQLWPSSYVKAKGDRMLKMLEFLIDEPAGVGSADLATAPPPAWKKVVDLLPGSETLEVEI